MVTPVTEPWADEVISGADPDICGDRAGDWERRRRSRPRRRRGPIPNPLGRGRSGAVPIARTPGSREAP